MSVEDLEVGLFDVEAVLVKYRERHQIVSRRAALGLLLNRVRRMRVPYDVRIEIICGHTVFDQREIVDLLNSAAYGRWLTLPLLARSGKPH